MEHLYIGVDVGKTSHTIALYSPALLATNKRYEKCPTKSIPNTHTGFSDLLTLIKQYTDPVACHVLLERTGHYGFALEQYLAEHDITLYRIMAQKRYAANKNDKKDSQALGIMLYNQIELHTPIVNPHDRVRPLRAPLPEAQLLRGMVRHRAELVQERAQRENKMISISDELFPEMASFYSDMNSPSAITLRERFPTPESLCNASIDELCATRARYQPSREKLALLQQAARETIGLRDEHRRVALLMEQKQLIREWRLLTSHINELEEYITAIVQESRAGRILTSFVGVSPVQAATLLAHIGSIDNFESVASLRNYMGWAPRQSQTGTSFDRMYLDKGGNRLLKSTMYFITINAVKYDPTWKALCERLVRRKCDFDERTGKYRGRKKVYGRVAGQIISLMFTLLKRDADLLRSWQGPGEPPEPTLYDPAIHARSIGTEKGGDD